MWIIRVSGAGEKVAGERLDDAVQKRPPGNQRLGTQTEGLLMPPLDAFCAFYHTAPQHREQISTGYKVQGHLQIKYSWTLNILRGNVYMPSSTAFLVDFSSTCMSIRYSPRHTSAVSTYFSFSFCSFRPAQ